MPLFNPSVSGAVAGAVPNEKFLPVYACDGASISDGTNNSRTANFWSNTMAGYGARVSSTLTAATWQTIASISGAGAFSTLVGPMLPSIGAVIDFEVTVDGALRTSTFTAVTSTVGARFVFGALSNSLGFQTPVPPARNYDTSPSSAITIQPANTNARINGPRVIFNTSLLIRIRSNVTITDTGNFEPSSGFLYQLQA
jgi:hypothetical protein